MNAVLITLYTSQVNWNLLKFLEELPLEICPWWIHSDCNPLCAWAGSLADLSKDELKDRLQEASEVGNVKHNE